MRADRLIRAVLLLQSRGRLTAAELADELEVSVPTARRDLEALSAAGVPVYAQPGRNGGWSLVGGARTDLTGLTSAEAGAVAEQLARSEGADPALSSALRKVLRALPEPFRAPAERVQAAVLVDAGGWGQETGGRPDGLDVIIDATARGVQVAFGYRNRAGEVSTVRVSPVGVVDKDGTWYLMAQRGDGERRTYRVDRMREVIALTEPSQVPAPSEGSATEWARVVEEVEAARSTCAATIRLAERHVWVIRRQFGDRHVEVLAGPDDDGWVTARVRAQIPLDIARYLAGWGAQVQLLEPEVVRAELRRLATELVAAVGTSGS